LLDIRLSQIDSGPLTMGIPKTGGAEWLSLIVSGCLSRGDGHVVLEVDALGDVVGRENDDFAAGELMFVVGDDLRRIFGYVDGWTAKWLLFLRLRFFRLGLFLRSGREVAVDEL